MIQKGCGETECAEDLNVREVCVEEEDFLSAELEIVPAEKCKRSGSHGMIAAYGQDLSACAITIPRQC